MVWKFLIFSSLITFDEEYKSETVKHSTDKSVFITRAVNEGSEFIKDNTNKLLYWWWLGSVLVQCIVNTHLISIRFVINHLLYILVRARTCVCAHMCVAIGAKKTKQTKVKPWLTIQLRILCLGFTDLRTSPLTHIIYGRCHLLYTSDLALECPQRCIVEGSEAPTHCSRGHYLLSFVFCNSCE